MTDHSARYDDIGSMLSEVGASRRNSVELLGLGETFGAPLAYAQGGLVARVIDMPADAATARGVTVEGADDEFTAELDRLRVLPMLSDALRWALLEGGAVLVVFAVDGGALAEPLNLAGMAMIEEFRVVRDREIRPTPGKLYNDAERDGRNYGRPSSYQISFVSGSPVEVHESRIIPIPGAPTANVLGDTNRLFWHGRGLAPTALRAIERYRRGVNWAEKLLERSQQAVHGMEGLAEMLMAGQEAVVRKRIDLVDSNRSSINGVAVDAGDSYTITTASLSGVKDTLGEMQVAVSAETGIPVTILFGRSPGGMDATGDSDWATFNESVAHLQGQRLTVALERICSLIWAQTGVPFEETPDEWSIKWSPLAKLSETQRVEADNKRADTLNKIANAVKTAIESTQISQDDAAEFVKQERLFGMVPDAEAGDAAAARRYAGET